MKHALLAAAACLTVAGAATVALANDSTAEMTAGGLVLRNSRNIDMLDEDLFVSAEQVRVDYVFKNQSRADETVTVAFPMPDRDLTNEGESDVAHVHDFVTTVEGQPVRTQVERKAMLGTRDVTATLTRMGLPLAPSMEVWEGAGDPPPDPFWTAFRRLTRAQKAELVRLRLIDSVGSSTEDPHLLWTVKEAYYWRQTFPAGRELRINHRYAPGTGGSVGALLAVDGIRSQAEGRAQIREYCADQAFLAGVDRLKREAGENGLASEVRFGYILTTGANWRAPIRNFRLVVDKGDPRNIVSFCGTGVRRVGPTQFEVRHQNWRPTQDLRVLVVRPYQPYVEGQ